MSIVILQDEMVHYEVLGRGKPLIFLHGWVGSWRYWISAMQTSSVSFRTYALDLWGFGDTAKAMSYYSLDQQVTLLDIFLQAMGVPKIAIIGHGLGAAVAMLYANRNERWVDRIMAISLPKGNSPINPRMYTASPDELADWLLSHSADSEIARMEVPKADPNAIQYSLTGLEKYNLSTIAQRLNTPCLLVYGQNDPGVEEISPQDQYIKIPKNMHQIVFEQSGHFPMLDESGKFNRLLSDFLNLNSGVSPRQLQLKEEWKRRVR
jgi:pimeloyl-ACP methyl ester carboxylesterase